MTVYTHKGLEVLCDTLNKHGAFMSIGVPATDDYKQIRNFIQSFVNEKMGNVEKADFHLEFSHKKHAYHVSFTDSYLSIGPVHLDGPTNVHFINVKSSTQFSV